MCLRHWLFHRGAGRKGRREKGGGRERNKRRRGREGVRERE